MEIEVSENSTTRLIPEPDAMTQNMKTTWKKTSANGIDFYDGSSDKIEVEEAKECPYMFDDIVFSVMQFVVPSKKVFASFRRVSRTWNRVCTHSYFWKPILDQELSKLPKPKPLNNRKLGRDGDWNQSKDDFCHMEFNYILPKKLGKVGYEKFLDEFEMNYSRLRKERGRKHKQEELIKNRSATLTPKDIIDKLDEKEARELEEEKIMDQKKKEWKESFEYFQMFTSLAKQKKAFSRKFQRSRVCLDIWHQVFLLFRPFFVSWIPALIFLVCAVLLFLQCLFPDSFTIECSFYCFVGVLFLYFVYMGCGFSRIVIKACMNYFFFQVKGFLLFSHSLRSAELMYENCFLGVLGVFPLFCGISGYYLRFLFGVDGILAYLPLILSECFVLCYFCCSCSFFFLFHCCWFDIQEKQIEKDSDTLAKSLGENLRYSSRISYLESKRFYEDRFLILLHFLVSKFVGMGSSMVFNLYVVIQCPVYVEFGSIIPSYVFVGLFVLICLLMVSIFCCVSYVASRDYTRYCSTKMILCWNVSCCVLFGLISIWIVVLFSISGISLSIQLIPCFLLLLFCSLFFCCWHCFERDLYNFCGTDHESIFAESVYKHCKFHRCPKFLRAFWSCVYDECLVHVVCDPFCRERACFDEL